MPKTSSHVKTATPAQAAERQIASHAQFDLLGDLERNTRANLALLIRMSQAMSTDDLAFENDELDRLAWYGINMLCRDILKDIEEVLRDSGVQESGFAMFSNDEGGEK